MEVLRRPWPGILLLLRAWRLVLVAAVLLLLPLRLPLFLLLLRPLLQLQLRQLLLLRRCQGAAPQGCAVGLSCCMLRGAAGGRIAVAVRLVPAAAIGLVSAAASGRAVGSNM